MTQEEYLSIRDKMESAQESTRPFAIPTEDEVVVVGDANDTKVNKSNFKIDFRLPEEKDGRITYSNTTIEYKNVFITPRQDSKIVSLIVDMLPFYYKVQEDGGVEHYDSKEIVQLLSDIPDEIYDKMYAVVGSVLGIDKRLTDFMTPTSVMDAFAQICETFPEVINEADAFFDKSPESQTNQ